jgi:flagellar motor protein MotB
VSKKVDNLKLSLDRAVSIADFLIKNGVKKERISVSAYGQYRPLDTNLTAEGRSKNRRVEINIIINKPNKKKL